MINKQLHRLLDEIENEYRITSKMTGKRKLDPRVKSALSEVPRDKFVPKDEITYAYENGPFPIGYGQTISQPYIVALMTDLLELEADHTVLEIGTGSGYQAAILSLLCKQVYSIEYVLELAKIAKNKALSALSVGMSMEQVCISFQSWSDDHFYVWYQHFL